MLSLMLTADICRYMLGLTLDFFWHMIIINNLNVKIFVMVSSSSLRTTRAGIQAHAGHQTNRKTAKHHGTSHCHRHPKGNLTSTISRENQSYKPTITTMSLLLNRTTRMNDLTQWQSLCQGAFSRATL